MGAVSVRRNYSERNIWLNRGYYHADLGGDGDTADEDDDKDLIDIDGS